MSCLFCKIANGETGDLVYEDDQVVAFNDIKPQAPVHLLIVPRRHISTINDIRESDHPLFGHLLQVAQQLASKNDIAENGYRVLLNCNADGGQSVFHIHLHLLGGRQMNWPPG